MISVTGIYGKGLFYVGHPNMSMLGFKHEFLMSKIVGKGLSTFTFWIWETILRIG